MINAVMCNTNPKITLGVLPMYLFKYWPKIPKARPPTISPTPTTAKKDRS